MALDKWTNTGLSTLASGIDASQLTATLAAGTGSRFPADTFNVVLWDSTTFANPIDAADREIVRCTSRTGDVLTIVRGQEGTTGVAHNTAGKTYSVALIVSQKFRDDLHALIIQNVSTQVFTAGGTYTKPSNLIAARVIVVAGGGGGSSTGTSSTNAGGGGGSGAYSESMFIASAIGATETVTVGAGGAAGAAGGTSLFGTLVTANGGSGATTIDAQVGPGAAGGTPGTGQVALAGGMGSPGAIVDGSGGNGGSSALGGGGAGRAQTAGAGSAGLANTGGGGGGAKGASQTGGAGGSGIVIVQEFKAG